MRIGSIIILHLSKLWKAKFSILCDAIFLVRLQRKFEIDYSWEWRVNCPLFCRTFGRNLEIFKALRAVSPPASSQCDVSGKCAVSHGHVTDYLRPGPTFRPRPWEAGQEPTIKPRSQARLNIPGAGRWKNAGTKLVTTWPPVVVAE